MRAHLQHVQVLAQAPLAAHRVGDADIEHGRRAQEAQRLPKRLLQQQPWPEVVSKDQTLQDC